MVNVWCLFDKLSVPIRHGQVQRATIGSHLSAIKYFHLISRGFELDRSHPVVDSAFKATTVTVLLVHTTMAETKPLCAGPSRGPCCLLAELGFLDGVPGPGSCGLLC